MALGGRTQPVFFAIFHGINVDRLLRHVAPKDSVEFFVFNPLLESSYDGLVAIFVPLDLLCVLQVVDKVDNTDACLRIVLVGKLPELFEIAYSDLFRLLSLLFRLLLVNSHLSEDFNPLAIFDD